MVAVGRHSNDREDHHRVCTTSDVVGQGGYGVVAVDAAGEEARRPCGPWKRGLRMRRSRGADHRAVGVVGGPTRSEEAVGEGEGIQSRTCHVDQRKGIPCHLVT